MLQESIWRKQLFFQCILEEAENTSWGRQKYGKV